jgi:hypothetical protein
MAKTNTQKLDALSDPPTRAEGRNRLQQAREKAAEYTENQVAGPAQAEKSIRSLEAWADIVGQRIEEAMRQGAFDNLPGHGKPLNLQSHPFTPVDQQMAFSLLKNNDLLPSWIAARGDVLRDMEKLRAALRATSAHFSGQWQAAATETERQRLTALWSCQIDAWEVAIRELNRRIATLNLQQPIAHLEIFKLRLEEELARAGAARAIGGDI